MGTSPDTETPEVGFKMFRGRLVTWEELFSKAAEYASNLADERLISISHSAAGGDGVVVVWYRK